MYYILSDISFYLFTCAPEKFYLGPAYRHYNGPTLIIPLLIAHRIGDVCFTDKGQTEGHYVLSGTPI